MVSGRCRFDISSSISFMPRLLFKVLWFGWARDCHVAAVSSYLAYSDSTASKASSGKINHLKVVTSILAIAQKQLHAARGLANT